MQTNIFYTISIVWHFKYCFICSGCWNTCRNSWSIFIIENLISKTLIDFEITHEEFSKIIYEKNNYEQIIDNIRCVNSVDDLNKENN